MTGPASLPGRACDIPGSWGLTHCHFKAWLLFSYSTLCPAPVTLDSARVS